MAKPTEVSSEELRRKVSDLLKQVEYSKREFVITMYGKPVARLVPLEDDADKSKKAKP